MKKSFYLIISLFVLITACEKNSLFVGNKEFLTIEYRNSVAGPEVSGKAIDASPFIKHGQISAENVGMNTVEISIEGVRVQSKSNNFEVKSIEVFERDGNRFEPQFEFDQISSSNKTDIAVVLVLDMSTSLTGLIENLKDYAKDFVDRVVNSTDNSKVAVVFFNSRDKMVATNFHDRISADLLKNQIDDFNDLENRTALFDATLMGINLLDNLPFEGEKVIVAFTDGGDNDSDSPGSKIAQIRATNYLRISIGLEGADFDKKDLQAIASEKSNAIVVKKKEKLAKAFDDVARQVVSVYKVVYELSDRILEEFVQIKFEFKVEKL